MNDVTQLLNAIEQGDQHSSEQLLPLVYAELHRLAAQLMAREKPGQTLQPTALVHEAYLRLVGSDPELSWDSRYHFFAAAAEAMRRILLDRARDKNRLKRGGGWRRLHLDQVDVVAEAPPEDLPALDDAIQKLAREDARCAELVKLRLFAGLTMEQTASALGLACRTAERYWAFARSWLYDELRRGEEAGQD
jgi:RNA polymerase sigma factor (TIGR02999 family)